MSHANAYIWYYLDGDAWKPYDSSLLDGFEKSFNSSLATIGNKKIKVDNERYIEIMPIADILSNFTNSINDPDLVGIQRRFDDAMKRRAVKRTKANTTTSFFDDLQFAFYSNTSQKTKTNEIKGIIKICGGKSVDTMTKKTDYLILKPSDLKDDYKTFNDIISKAEGLKIICVESTWIDSCIKSKKLVDHTAFLVGQKTAPVVAIPTNTTTATTATTTTTNTGTATATSPKSKSKNNSTSTTNNLVINSGFLIKGSEWAGVCSSDDDHYPLVMTVDDFVGDGEEVSGVITWINLGYAKTKYKGKVVATNGEFNFQEYEIISGEDDVEVPNDYKSTIYGDQIIGKVGDSTFKLKLTKSPPVTNIQPDSQWKGTSTSIENFKLDVVKRDGENITGTITWGSNYDDAISTFTGKITSSCIEVSDYKEGKKLGPEELSHPFKLIPSQQSDHSIKFRIEK
ncbi:BRCT domain-containing protein [Dictyostelium discoideum AX4]|uniref:BRCT domain-containing protein n=1 Tax=Dictyostelium discoideum TaxID=44689 RepID=Q76NX0_DICDI|nr:BRCT domain-containing protein [Dictyostelium discoideum AX4]EAL70239.2 BRCT domain-containing protein [Dictyostelium discoideum AX4]|eukprot:XP_644060.2 BRCT domain-containing protein [Dictyostelium discoideum AX4]